MPPPGLIDEIEFFVATDPAVRAAFVAAGTAKRPARAVRRGMAPVAGPDALLRRRGSAALRAALDG